MRGFGSPLIFKEYCLLQRPLELREGMQPVFILWSTCVLSEIRFFRMHMAGGIFKLVVPAFVLVCCVFSIREAAGASLGGAYFIDDAEIGAVGSCEIEHWASFAANSDRIYVSNPACVFNLGRPMEIGATFLRTRSAGEWGSTLALTAKTVFIASEGSGWGLGLSASMTHDFKSAANGVIVNVPVTYDFNKQLRFNANVGWLYDPGQQQHFMTGGVGVAWNFVKPLSLLAEIFTTVGSGEIDPRFQVGLRYNPSKLIDVDVIYGRNLSGERSNWITVGLNFRTGSP